jgi:tRNA uridine 5-carboxymethylaminomethyl modification enzyme
MEFTYDIIVIGAGHAGCEAAHASATLGAKVLLITMSLESIARMSCNPAMGGVAKGQIVKEIDALGGLSGIVTDLSTIQFRMLNLSKGPAMWSPRAQCDRHKFSQEWRRLLEQNFNISFFQDNVEKIFTDTKGVSGLKTNLGFTFFAKSVIVTSGTFLNGLIHIGLKNFGGGRMGDAQSIGLTASLSSFGFKYGRMKTGTPPRVDGRSLNYDLMLEQKGDIDPGKFSFSNTFNVVDQKSCFITYTNENVHSILREGFNSSPMFNGSITSLGPRYCPSIEDKINRFADRPRHHIFVEPEGRNTIETYVNGFSTSLPEDIQIRALTQIPGFENAKIFRPGYAIEYDYFPPTQLDPSLMTKLVPGLFFAGQINGTTGYEEAACQGLIAGINSYNFIHNRDPFILKRSEAYIGVLIDDLVNKGTDEPYRMFTSRAEYRILLRQDNADERLTPIGHSIGLVSDERMFALERKKSNIEKLLKYYKRTSIAPVIANPVLEENNSAPINNKVKLWNMLSRPQISTFQIEHLNPYAHYMAEFSRDEKDSAEILLKYDGYIEKEQNNADKIITLDLLEIHDSVDYRSIRSLSSEAREKLLRIKPKTIGQASRISGVSPSDISVLLVHLGR